MKNAPLSLGILLDSFSISSWAYHALNKSLDNGDITIDALIIRKCKPQPAPSLVGKILNPHLVFWSLFHRFDRFVTKILPSTVPDPRKPQDIRRLAPEAQVIEVTPKTGKHSDWIQPGDISRIQSCKLDILFRAGFRILRGDILNTCSRYGVWSFHHGDDRTLRGQPSGFWEFTEKRATIGAILQVLSEDLDGGTVLAKTIAGVRLSYTWKRLLDNLYWKASAMLPKCLHVVACQGEEGYRRLAAEHREVFDIYDRPMYVHPKTLASLRAFSILSHKLIRTAIKRIRRKLFGLSGAPHRPKWEVLYHFPKEPLLRKISLSMRKFKRLDAPDGHFWSDPFIYERNGKQYLYFEDYIYRDAKANISVAELTKNGLAGPPAIVLDEDIHLSYPFLFEYGDDLHMIPETKRAKQIRVYRCTEFPAKWELKTVLLDNVLAADTTVFPHDGKWWMLTTICSMENTDSNGLYLFHSDSPLEGWHPHPHNPIVTDIKYERSAGQIINIDGKLYRPCQNGIEYGWGVSICEITHLSTEIYQEKHVGMIEPKWDDGVLGVHTLNMTSGCVVSDCKLTREWEL